MGLALIIKRRSAAVELYQDVHGILGEEYRLTVLGELQTVDGRVDRHCRETQRCRKRQFRHLSGSLWLNGRALL